MIVEGYIHYQRLVDFHKGQPVLIKFNFMGNDDVKVNFKASKYVILRTKDGILIRKKTFIERIMFWRLYMR